MQKSLTRWNDDKMRQIMGNLLRVGVITAAVTVVLGGVLFFIQHPNPISDYHAFKSEPAKLRQLHQIILQAVHFRGRDIIQLGLILLIATPVARVVFSLIGFVFEKDWIYVAITFTVLIVLIFSLFNTYFVI